MRAHESHPRAPSAQNFQSRSRTWVQVKVLKPLEVVLAALDGGVQGQLGTCAGVPRS